MAALASRAGAAIIACRGVSAQRKPDGSPVCAADRLAEEQILAGLSTLLPGITAISEESFERAAAPDPECFLLVDPLDGTKSFLTGTDEFTVNIALIEAGRPTLGCLYAPARSLLWLAGQTTSRHVMQPGSPFDDSAPALCRVRKFPPGDGVALTSLSHVAKADLALAKRFGTGSLLASGSSLKFGMLADGQADVYPRCGRVMAWDIAAGHAVLAGAGGKVVELDGREIDYRTLIGEYDVSGFVAVADPQLLDRLTPQPESAR